MTDSYTYVGKETLIPLTSSLYVAGSLNATDKVMLDIGTGYYVEKSNDSGIDYCKRKVQLLTDSLNALAEVCPLQLQILNTMKD